MATLQKGTGATPRQQLFETTEPVNDSEAMVLEEGSPMEQRLAAVDSHRPTTVKREPVKQDKDERTSVEVDLMGQRMVLRTDADTAHVNDLVAYVQRKIEAITVRAHVLTPHKLALLTAINCADDYFRALDELREFKQHVAHKSAILLAELDALEEADLDAQIPEPILHNGTTS